MMKSKFSALLLSFFASGCGESHELSKEVEPIGKGPYSVGSTNMEIGQEYADLGDEEMHEYLLGRVNPSGQPRFIADLLKYPESAWITDVPIPDEQEIYGSASGLTLPVVTFVTFPTGKKQQQNSYAFPYHDSRYGVFDNMLGAGEVPDFAESNARYPLIIIAHGASAHGLYDVKHAHSLASHGYIVAVITYGDDRTAYGDRLNSHVSFLRPLLTKAVLDSLLKSEEFGGHIDADNIGISGHSFGGFTALSVAGGNVEGKVSSVKDSRIKAGVLAAPWVGGNYDGNDVFAFGPDNIDLNRVSVPMICFFGTKDESTLASFILPAMKQLSGTTYVVELVDQPHVFEQGSWEDRDNWELLFFSAYLKHNSTSLKTLAVARSMRGGNEDVQLIEYQKLTGTN